MGHVLNRVSFLLLVFAILAALKFRSGPRCRSQPGDASFPSAAQWDALNSTVEGRFIAVVPFAKFCRDTQPGGFCTPAQYASSTFRNEVPGAMKWDNWEQDYSLSSPSTCLANHTGDDCGQGIVPLYAIAARSVSDLQVGVKFAAKHNLRVAIKASGHDLLGRSTAKNSLLLWTHHLQNITFTESFAVGAKSYGSAVTVGSGVTLNTLYSESKKNGKTVVAGTAATVAAAGGYLGGGGHSALSPTYGLAADNCFEIQVVSAQGKLLVTNEQQHPDLFWAIRGGGAGSWGVVVSATYRTFPLFDATAHTISLTLANSSVAGAIAEIHARHIFDIDNHRAGQYFFLMPAQTGPDPYALSVNTIFPSTSMADANTTMGPFLKDLENADVEFTTSVVSVPYNDLVSVPDDAAGTNSILGSRLIPATVFRDTPEKVRQTYQELLDSGIPVILSMVVAGGKVSESPEIDSAIVPAWRSAKSHLVISTFWSDDVSIQDVHALQTDFTQNKVPILARLAGKNSGAYSSEADIHEPDSQNLFFGENYERLSQIKRRYDPSDLFIVAAGVGSERWDEHGLCRV